MNLRFSVSDQDPYENHHQAVQLRKFVHEGQSYERRKYKIELTRVEQFLEGCHALLCTLRLLPTCNICFKEIQKVWKPALSRIDRKIVFIATHNLSLKNPYLDKNGSFEKATREEVLSLQDQIEDANPKYLKLNLTELNELFPTDKIVIDGVPYYCSEPFTMEGAWHVGVLGLVKVNGKAYPRIFYSSHSQGTWRCLPYYDGGEHFGKGIIENDTQLPMVLSLALHKRGLSLKLETKFPYRYLTECVMIHGKNYTNQFRIQKLIEIQEGFAKSFTKESQYSPFPPNPEALKMPEKDLSPNFEHVLEKRKIILAEYGKVKVKIYPSQNQLLHYTFYETEDKRVFIANVEKIKYNKINSYGLREEAFELHNLDAPLLEYSCQVSPGYEPANNDANRYQSKNYINNWNYISELKIIQDYYTSQKKPIPPKL